MTNRMNISTSQQSDLILNKTIRINASPSKVWEALTSPILMKKWMAETAIHIITDRIVGNPLSSLSRLPDEPRNYSILEFLLAAIETQARLALTLRNFPTEAI
jgi:uncharacterized protein YndB with AHSA1/START domain